MDVEGDVEDDVSDDAQSQCCSSMSVVLDVAAPNPRKA